MTRKRLLSAAVEQELWTNDGWKFRRRVLFSALGVAGGLIVYIIVLGQDSQLYRDAVSALIWASVSMVASYVFGAVFDDRFKRSAAIEAGAAPPPETE